MNRGDDREEMLARFRALVAAGNWGGAVRLAVGDGGVSVVDVSVRLEVTRSTVIRWSQDSTTPGSVPTMARKLEELLQRPKVSQPS